MNLNYITKAITIVITTEKIYGKMIEVEVDPGVGSIGTETGIVIIEIGIMMDTEITKGVRKRDQVVIQGGKGNQKNEEIVIGLIVMMIGTV